MFLYLLFSAIVITQSSVIQKKSHDWDSIIEKVNSAGTTWKAEKIFHPDYSLKHLTGTILDDKYDGPVKTLDDFKDSKSIPEEFDARKKWPRCKSVISKIVDQAYCGSCWAAAAASALTDRFCIFSNGKYKALLSIEDLLSCCNECGYGCEGGYMWRAWNYFKTEGIVSGGGYDSHLGCKPYSLKPCEHHMNGSRPPCSSFGELPTPLCNKDCTNTRHYNSFKKDHHKVKRFYRLASNATAIQREILRNGPVEAGFVVYEDFLTYKSGIYQHVTGKQTGNHAIKIIGWGVEKNVPYWLIANSWNSDWGENGYFRMLKGQNECLIESSVVAGIPDFRSSYH